MFNKIFFSIYLILISSSYGATNILMIGDSHTSQSFGIMMHANLSSIKDTNVATFGNCGSSPAGWMTRAAWAKTQCGFFHGFVDDSGLRGKNKKTPFLEDLLKNMNVLSEKVYIPDAVIIALGANQINSIDTERKFIHQKNTVKKMINMVSKLGIPCLWVGPPDGSLAKKPEAKQSRLYQMLQEAVTESGDYCKFFSSRAESLSFLKYPEDCNRDGAHYDACTTGRIRAVQWANAISREAIDHFDL